MTTEPQASDAGVSVAWIPADICYVGMKTQAHPSRMRRIFLSLFGLAGTLLSLLTIRESAERAYGIDLPKKRDGL